MSHSEEKYNYFEFSLDDEVLGVGAAEKGSLNETLIVDECIRRGLKVESITKEDYDEFEGDEIKND